MTILAQSFFALVSCHFVAFTFLSVWHIRKMLVIMKCGMSLSVRLLHLIHEHLSGLESRNLVLGNNDNGVLADIAGGLL